ncbi:MAG: beta-agarase, partial [Patescibacteria group bacterium]|nr:beta-agarase [Patescibacteria group bacterium]
CRFAWANELAVRASAEYCDVISFNKYRRSIADTALPEGIDLPIIIGEFHFGALDRGMLHTGLVPTQSQQERAAAYRAYVESALDNRFIVGTHWFQFSDQATTGRGGDGENYQIGLIDACDTPYPETIQALRDVGAAMYRRRAEGP